MKKCFKNKKGFTLIELLVVIAIIGILSAVVLVVLNDAKGKARDARRVSDVKQIERALIMYVDGNNGIFPSTGGAAKCLGLLNNIPCWGMPSGIKGDTNVNAAVTSYLPNVPLDPSASGRVNQLGDRYLYADQSASVWVDSIDCITQGQTETGPFILWKPEEVLNPTTAQCKGMGFRGCRGTISIGAGAFCAHKIQ